MKSVLVAYYSNGGTAKGTSNKLRNLNAQKVDIVDLKEHCTVDVKQYKNIYIGSGVYGGNLPLEISNFIKSNSSALIGKKVVFFIHALGSEDKYQEIVKKAVNGMILNYQVIYLGGRAELSKQNFFIKALIRMLAKKKNLDMEIPDNIITANVDKLVEMVSDDLQ